MAALQNAARHIRLVRITRTKPLDRRIVPAKCGQKLIREFLPVKGLTGEFRNGFFNFYSIHSTRFFYILWDAFDH